MEELTPIDRQALINAIANREGTARDLAKWYGVTTDDLRQFVADNKDEIEEAKAENDAAEERQSTLDKPEVVTPTQLDELWIGNKYARLKRYEEIADQLFQECQTGGLSGSDYATALRELRSYMTAAANELGQLLHRGAGENRDGDTLSVDISGVDIDALK